MTGWQTWWSSGAGGLEVVSNQCAPNGPDNDNGAYFNTAMAGPDVEAYVTVSTLPVAGAQTNIMARVAPSGSEFVGSAYTVEHFIASPDSIGIFHYDDATTGYTLLATWNQDLSAGDGIGIRCVGSVIQAWWRISGTWLLGGSVTDTRIPGTGSNNKLALYNYANGSTVARYDDFGGGQAYTGEISGPGKYITR